MRKKKMNLLGREAEVTEADILERKGERPAEYTLEDGSVIRIASFASSVIRVDGQYGPEGFPVYIVTSTNSVSVISAPEELKKTP